MDRYLVRIKNDQLVLLRIKEEEEQIVSYPLNYDKEVFHRLFIKREDEKLVAYFDDEEFILGDYVLTDLFGMGFTKQGRIRILELEVS